MSYVYKASEPQDQYGSGIWTVGYYDPAGSWVAESDHEDRQEAAARVHFLNGGSCHGQGGRIVDMPSVGGIDEHALGITAEQITAARAQAHGGSAPALTSASEQAQINAVTAAAVNVVEASLERVRVQKQAAEASYYCPDCGVPGERHGHQECSNPQDRVDHADNEPRREE